MRITAELLDNAERRMNPNSERELVLRDMGIAAIENMGAARDDYDSWDLTGNRISKLENFPRLKRLTTLLVSNNSITEIDASIKNASSVQNLSLGYNRIASLAQVHNISKAFPRLETLCLVGNPVTSTLHFVSHHFGYAVILTRCIDSPEGRPFYRLFTIWRIPSLQFLDFEKVTLSARENSRQLAASVAGAELEQDINVEASSAAMKTFVPGGSGFGKSFIATYTQAEKEKIRNMLTSAQSSKEVEEIENAVRSGLIPGV
jgi:U2 small nuclear ribonucleoprotein A'